MIDHVLHLFDTRESLGKTVATFLQLGCVAGECLLLVAKADNAERILRHLELLGVHGVRAQSDGRLHVIDAAAALEQMRGPTGHPDAALFDRAIGSRIRELSSRGPLRIYGEIVELLAERQEYEGALAVERFWESLSSECSFNLLCGYSSAHFAPARAESVLQRICGLHRSARATPDDTLGEWLLGNGYC
jgi:hypothetical protein